MATTKLFSDAIYEPTFRLEGPHLVAASAGTGKTYNIQCIYVRLVVEKGFCVPQIQVMTYTEAATKELRDRIRKVLATFSRFLAGDTTGMDEGERARMERLRACARANLAGRNRSADEIARARVELALMEFDQAAISTIHGFCRRVLLRFAFETESAFHTEFADDKAADLARRSRDWWRRERNQAPADVQSGIGLDRLTGFVTALAGKAGWTRQPGEASDAEAFLLARAEEIALSYAADRPNRDTQTFDDLIRGVSDVLADETKGPVLAARLREEFKAVLVDEFQDTDPLQYAIFKRVFLDVAEEPRPALFFVGDPKQAIYSFRGGDIYTYKTAVETEGVRKNAYKLIQNFRSTPRLIDAVNVIFKDVQRPGEAIHRTFGDEAIDYGEATLSSKRAKAFQVGGKDDPQPFKFIAVEKSAQREEAVVNAVLSVLEEQGPNGLTPKDVAILVSSHDRARELCERLRGKGVPVVLQKAGNVFASAVAEEFRIVLQAMALEGGAGQVRAALATSFFTTTPEDLANDTEKTMLANLVAFFGELNRLWLARGFPAAFAALEAHPNCALRRRFAQETAGERKLADLLQIVDLASAAVKELGPAPDLLVKWMTDRINQAGEAGAEQDSEAYARELESESDAVKIMTMHVSKGLEFPVVLVPVAGEMAASAPFFYHVDGRLFVSVDPADREKAEAERVAEKTRLLYVAFTRASKRTIVVAAKKELKEGASPLGNLVANAVANGGTAVDSPIEWIDYEPPADSETRRYRPPVPPARQWRAALEPRTFPDRPTKGSYTSLAPTAGEEGGDGHDFDSVEPPGCSSADEDHPIFTIGGGAQTGTCWHEILEKIPFDASPEQIRAETEAALLLHGVVRPDEEDRAGKVQAVAAMIEKTLAFPLTSPTGQTFTLQAIDWPDRLSEWEFDFSSSLAVESTEALASILRDEWRNDAAKAPFLAALDGWSREIPKGYLKGFLDLLFRHDGFYYVVDWKSNILDRERSGFCSEGVRREMAEAGYFFQYLLYSVVLHRFLKETLGERYSWERNFGGIRYYFLRGIASGGAAPVFVDRPSEALLDRLAAALGLEG